MGELPLCEGRSQGILSPTYSASYTVRSFVLSLSVETEGSVWNENKEISRHQSMDMYYSPVYSDPKCKYLLRVSSKDQIDLFRNNYNAQWTRFPNFYVGFFVSLSTLMDYLIPKPSL